LGNATIAETCFRRVIALEKTCLLEHQHYDALDTDDPIVYKTSWAGAYALYEMALLKCLPAPSSAEPQAKKIKEAREWLRRVDQFHQQHHHHHSGNATNKSGANNGSSSSMIDVSCESACMLLHIRCQLLYEKLDELLDD
jgi:hypothetical protein